LARKTVYNDICTLELWDRVNKKNKELLSDFVEYLNSTDKSDLTVINYVSDLKICFVWSLLHNDNKCFIDFTKRDFMHYQNFLINELNLSPARIRRLRSSMSSMGNFIENILDDEFPTYRNIVNKIPAPVKNEVREKTILSDEQIESLLTYLIEKEKYQQACLLALAVASGARKSELLRFKVNYFDDENIVWGSLYKTPEKIRTKGRGKSGKLLYKYTIVKTFKPYLDLWLQQREKLEIDNKWLFVSKRKGQWQQMQISTVDTWTEHWGKYLNVDFYIHSLRHLWTTSLSRQNLPPSLIQKLQGWENLEMVALYDDRDVDEEIGNYFDENGIKQVEQKGLSSL
jgi:integrase